MKEGWICPRCKKVNAPFIPFCDCQEKNYTNYANQVDCINGYHKWECCGVDTGGTTYRCRVCGKFEKEKPYDKQRNHIT